ncbi:hypothetical protein HYPSUDRAFT_200966 [Hypholoma sublateritium FD-334 SS-4]|uniref:Uncharacterized protein n=1 Tax=Hypholoma sublateritium (strain FD-334 SS-4) TaxID=945553 RepID=A0A0D2PWF4_HYPSF|nr:hypothetical protein HYPSUDRAFT_200966 [Hypholoma sublateritium FD-334 SS-4]
MLLKLIPATQEPTIHFSLTFADPPSNLPAPPSWTAQLSHLMHEDLEVPATLHSLDRAAGISSLLEEVALDVDAKEIRCLFVDGSIERIAFGLRGQKNEQALMETVGSIVNDVKESTLEDERVMRQRELERQRARSVSVMSAPAPPTKSARSGKHKKQRSLFMHIVSSIGSIINLTTPASPNPALPFHYRSNPSGYRTSISSIPSPPFSPSGPPIPTPGSSPRTRALRRAARSALVDAYRRFVLGELVRRFYAGPDAALTVRDGEEYTCMYGLENHHQRERGGFCVWILHSMRRRALNRMEQLLEEAGPPPSPQRFSATTMDVPLSFSDEEEDELMPDSPVSQDSSERACQTPYPETNAMDVDADDASSASLQGPTNDHPPRPSLLPRRASSSASVSTDDSSESGSTMRSSSSMSCASTAPSSVESEPEVKEDNSPAPSMKELPIILHRPRYNSPAGGPTIDHMSPGARHEYRQLAALRTRLSQLAQFAASQSRVAADEVRSRLEVLAVRSRRRAWLNKALKGPLGKAGGSTALGLATPFRSSPLARYVLTADDVVRRQSSLSRSSTCSSASSLSSAYFRSVSSTSSASSVASATKGSSITPFPSSRPRLRPKLDYGAALAAAVVELADAPGASADAGSAVGGGDGLVVTTMEEMDEEDDAAPVEQEVEMYQEFNGPARPRRHRRSMQDVALPAAPRVATARLFPVDEERENENAEFTLALSGRPRRHGAQRGTAYAAREEVPGVDDEMSCDDDVPDLELGLGADAVAEIMPDDVESNAKPPQTRPRARTSSMVGALLRGAKRSFSGGLKLQTPPAALPTDSLLCQPVSATPFHPHALSKMAILPTASNRRAMDLARMPVTTTYANVDVEMEAGQMCVQLRIDDFDYTAGIPVGGTAGEFEAELQQYQAREQEFTLAMDVPRGGGKRWRNSQYTGPSEVPRRPRLSTVFGEGQGAANC